MMAIDNPSSAGPLVEQIGSALRQKMHNTAIVKHAQVPIVVGPSKKTRSIVRLLFSHTGRGSKGYFSLIVQTGHGNK